ncbi:MAG: nucleotidyltransferase family protein [Chloroflexota bacterium]|nr:nucleotidyltransferase family protein [Chloroflexota bacterium]
MQADPWKQEDLDPQTRAFYCRVLTILNAAQLPYLVGGAYAFERYTGIARHTKDLDLFVRQADYDRVMAALEAEGYRTELTFSHWLGKAYAEDAFIDVIFRSGNGVSEVNDGWFEHAVDAEVLGIPAKLCAVEDILWTKIFIMERERYDGADVAHLLRACAEGMDWRYLVQEVEPHYRVLLSHLILFGFIYPGERNKIPANVMRYLLGRVQRELGQPAHSIKLCQGSILSREQYLIDLHEWGYEDARSEPRGNMSPEEIEEWTRAINEKE